MKLKVIKIPFKSGTLLLQDSISYSTTETKTGGTWIDGKPIYKKYITIVMILCSFLMVSTASATEIVTVPVSQSRIMNFYAVQKVAIANPDIADVVVISPSEGDLLI